MEKDKRNDRRQFDQRGGVQQGPKQPAQEEAGKKSFFGRVQEALQTNRPADSPQVPQAPVPQPPPQQPVRREQPQAAVEEAAARPKLAPTNLKRMILPEGCIISGSLTSAAETEISGRVEGDVTVEGRLYLGPTAVIAGNVRAVSCRVEGHVEGRMECSQDIELGPTARLKADAKAEKQITVAGQVTGSAFSNGVVRLLASGRVEGNIQTRRLFIEEGATFNGKCIMMGSK